MKESFNRLFLLLWKNWTLQKRKRKRLIGDLIIPFFIGAFLLYLRYEVKIIEEPQVSRYESFQPKYIPPVPILRNRVKWNKTEILKLINSTIHGDGTISLPILYGGNETNLSGRLPEHPKWKLIWSPNHHLVNKIMKEACRDMDVIGSAVENAELLEQTMTVPSTAFPNPREEILAGVVFPEEIIKKNDLLLNMNINIRFPAELRFVNLSEFKMIPRNWLTGLIFPMIQLPGPREKENSKGGTPGYYAEGFLGIEDAISSAVLYHHLNNKKEIPKFDIKLTRFPYPGFTVDPMIIVMQKFLPFLLVISFLFAVKTMTEKITTEKERRLKIVMNIMGLSDSLRWTSWFIYSMIFFSVLAAVLIIVFKVPMVYGPVLPSSDWSCLFLFFMCYMAAATTYCFLISTIFSKAAVASTVSGMGWFLLFVPFYIIDENYADIDMLSKCIASFLLNTGMAIGMRVILVYEGSGPGIQWDNIMKPATPGDEMTFALSLVLILLDCLLYLGLALYIENVFPGQYGTPLPWYYPFQRSYWFREKKIVNESYNTDEEFDYPFEREQENLPAGIQIKNLRKVYSKNKRAAVQNLSLNVYEGQITVLMGFNGAGKTTTLSILTGIYPPTSGTATVAGYDVVTNIKDVRKGLGFCPQYNVLFDELNVEEHIKFYGKLKGLNNEQIAADMEKYIGLLNLKDKSKTLSVHLSGGMKRKLSVALAMCGDMKVLILDEPTAGMDSTARRSLWDLLISEKKGRTILITTHHLDEANLLGDKVAIMSQGKLNCFGSTFFLKKYYSCGYRLKIIKKDDCDSDKITKLVRQNISEDVKAEDVGMEISYQLPDQHSKKFQNLFRVLEDRQDKLKIVGFGVTPTTLEDVFMKISYEVAENDEQKEPNHKGSHESVNVKISDISKLTGFSLLVNQIRAMFYKHIKYSIRSWKLYILLLLITICGLSNAIFTIRLNERLVNLSPRVLQLKDFVDGKVTIQSGDKCVGDCNKFFMAYKDVMKSQNMNITEITNENMDDYLLKECDRNEYIYRNQHILGTTFHVTKLNDIETTEINGWFNALPYHTAPIALTNIYNALFHSLVAPQSSLTFINEPLPYREKTKVDIQGTGIDRAFQIAMFTAFTYIFVSSSFILFPIQERETKAKLLQFVSGIGPITFWFVIYIWNLVMAIGLNLAFIITLIAFQEEGFREPKELAYCGFILMVFFVGFLPLLYLASLFWNKPSLGFIIMSFFSIITGIFTIILVMILRMPNLDLADVGDALDWVFSIFPLYSLGRSIQNMNIALTRLDMCKPIYDNFCLPNKNFTHICCKVPEKCPNGVCVDWTESPLDWNEPGFGRYITFMFIVGIVSFILLLTIEYGVFNFIKHRKKPLPKGVDGGDKDFDVIAEREKVLNLPVNERENYSLILDGVSKKFAKYVAVNNLYLMVKASECFGLLGANGAGKTTTFRILAGDEYPSSGKVFVKGLSLNKDMKEIRQKIGYCPQFDALIDDLTGMEHLRIYCLIRGIPSAEVDATSLQLARELLFEEFLNKKVGQYSGGNKRKLSTALALIGNPSIIYLDEPTAGVDPAAKRHLWAVINRLRSEGKTIVLTSHSMEECEALCTRLTIMVKGEFKCLGTTQYLKNKYCEGYSLTIKIKKNKDEQVHSEKLDSQIAEIEEFVTNSFPGAVQLEKHEELLVYRIPYSGFTVSKTFGLIESVKDRLNIEDYSLGQTTLEQILLKITGQHVDNDG